MDEQINIPFADGYDYREYLEGRVNDTMYKATDRIENQRFLDRVHSRIIQQNAQILGAGYCVNCGEDVTENKSKFWHAMHCARTKN